MWGVVRGKRKKDNCPSTPPSNSLFILAEMFLGVIAVGDASAAEARWVVTLPKGSTLFQHKIRIMSMFSQILFKYASQLKYLKGL